MLRPLEANNFDVAYENYFDDEGYVSVAVFYKDLGTESSTTSRGR